MAAALSVALVAYVARDGASAACGPGFVQRGARCVVEGACPPPLAVVDGVCDAPRARVHVAATRIVIGPSDWEAEGRVAPRVVDVAPFDIDAFEATEGNVHHARDDAARAAGGLSLDEARAACAARGGRLPKGDEWLAAAAGEAARRYPWGDTGAVCRRAAWGLASGPCARGAVEPDTVGAHPAGDTATGIHDLAGNVAEWVDDGARGAAVRGGSFRTELATELRTWARVALDPRTRDPAVGVRCAYDAPR